MVTLEELARLLVPDRTVLFLGAGTSVPSGAPTAAALAQRLCNTLAKAERISDDLMETCSILDQRYGRTDLVREIRSILYPLQPTGGLLALPEFDWHALYTTNFDRLVELSYRRAGKEVVPVRSNFEYGRTEASDATPLFKVHGCITQDIVDGSFTRMVLTESDYEEYRQFRETIWNRLALDLTTKDVVIIGYSLRDPHLRRDMIQAADLHKTKGAPGRLCALIYESDPDRAQLMERRGFHIAFGGIDEFFHALTAAGIPVDTVVPAATVELQLPPRLRPTAIEVAHALSLSANPVKLFNGSPATYADIKAGLTFSREGEKAIAGPLADGKKRFLSVIGVAGVGKTTFARRLLHTLVSEHGFHAWEHNSDFPFRSAYWLAVERTLRETGRKGVLLLDDCTGFMRQVNTLAETLSKTESAALRLILTCNSSQWLPRIKAPELFADGVVHTLSILVGREIDDLIRLVEAQPAIRALVDPGFSRLSRVDQIQQLRNRCSADMYVCLKNIFATDELDTILLREFAALGSELQDVYRHVAVLEASGTKVHRQLILRVLGVEAGQISSMLALMEGLVDEYDIKPADGLYGWCTRHEVVARAIARYKFGDDEELYALFKRVIVGLNPTIWLELRTIRDICGTDFGIGRLIDHRRQVALFEDLIRLAPGERIPRHRLISKLLFLGEIEGAAQALRAAEEVVGVDAPISRYKVRLALRRAETTAGILEEDRRAMLREAQRLALDAVGKYVQDKFVYATYAEVGLAIAERTDQTDALDDALSRMRHAADRILDPWLSEQLRSIERTRRRFK